MNPMIFAVSTDDCVLHVFSGKENALHCAAATEVAQGGWLFFSESGQLLEPVFCGADACPSCSAEPGQYQLVDIQNCSLELLALLPAIAAVVGQAPFDNLQAVETLLAFYRGDAPDGMHQ